MAPAAFLFQPLSHSRSWECAARASPPIIRLINICLALPEAPNNQICWLLSKHHSYVKCGAEVTESSPAHSGGEFDPIVG